MIKLDRGQTEFDGSANVLASELSHALHHLATLISEQTDDDYREVLNKIVEGASIYRLIDAGMDTEEAMKVLSLDGKIHQLDEGVKNDDTN